MMTHQNDNFKKIKSICTLISETTNFNIFFINNAGESCFEILPQHFLHPLYMNDKNYLFNLLHFDPQNKYSIPVIRKAAFFENYVICSVFSDAEFYGNLLIGPILFNSIPEIKIKGFLNDSKIFYNQEKICEYYKSIPIVDNKKLINIAIMMFYMLNGILFTAEEVRSINSIEDHYLVQDNSVQLSASYHLQNGFIHHDPLKEKKIFNIIKEGRVDDLKTFFSSFSEEEVGILSKTSYIRSVKNQLICLITLVSRTAIEGGLSSEEAFSLSDTFIQKLEELHSIEKLKHLSVEVRYTYTKKVQEAKDKPYTGMIMTVKNHILNHIYENLKHTDIAALLNISPTYLSIRFKKEVGIPLRDYIRQQKIEEAKKILALSNTSLSEIVSLLNFSDQSYFTKIFKQMTGVTPKQYREQFVP